MDSKNDFSNYYIDNIRLLEYHGDDRLTKGAWMYKQMQKNVRSSKGEPVVAVGSGQEAVVAAKEASFSLAFVDIIMSGMDGLAVLKALLAEQQRVLPKTPM